MTLRTTANSLSHDLASLPKALWILSLGTFLNRVGTMALPFLVLYLTEAERMTAERAALLVGSYAVGSLLAGPLAGWMCDRWGGSKLLLASLWASGGILMLYPFASGFPALLAVTVVWAGASELFRPASLVLTNQLAPRGHEKLAVAVNRFAINLGMSIGPVVGGILAERSYSALFFVDAATSLFAALILSCFFAPPKPQGIPSKSGIRGGIQEALCDRKLLFLLVATLPVSFIFFQGESTLPLFLTHHLGWKKTSYGFLFTINTVLILFLEIPLIKLCHHWSYRRNLVMGSVLYGIGFGCLAFAAQPLLAVLGVVLWTFGEMFFFPATGAYVSAISPAHRKGAYMGLYFSSFSAAMLVAPWIGTRILDSAGAQILWGVCLLAGITAALALGNIQEPHAERVV